MYREAGTIEGAQLLRAVGLTTEVTLPPGKTAGTVHVILQAEDDGNPHLFAYRRAIITVAP